MQQEVECCAEVITQEQGEEHFLLSDLNDLQQGTAKFCVENVIISSKTCQTYFSRIVYYLYFLQLHKKKAIFSFSYFRSLFYCNSRHYRYQT